MTRVKEGRRSSRSCSAAASRRSTPGIHAAILAPHRELADDLADLRRGGDRAVRPRLRQPLPVRAGRRATRGRTLRGGRSRADQHRRPLDAAGGGEELRARDARLPRRRLRDRAGGAAPRRRRLARDEAGPWATRAFPDDGHLRARDLDLVLRRGRGALPRGRRCWRSTRSADLAYGENPRPGGARYCAKHGGPLAPAGTRGADPRAGALRSTTSTTSTPRGSSPASRGPPA